MQNVLRMAETLAVAPNRMVLSGEVVGVKSHQGDFER